MSVQELAEHLSVPVATVYAWRSKGTGPTGFRVGRHVRYRREDVESWLEDHRDPTPAMPDPLAVAHDEALGEDVRRHMAEGREASRKALQHRADIPDDILAFLSG